MTQIGMDFTDLPTSEGYDSVLTVIDHGGKMAHFVMCNKTIDTNGLAHNYAPNELNAAYLTSFILGN